MDDYAYNLFGHFPGLVTPDEKLTMKALASRCSELIPLEPRLTRAKWFDYRFMHPGRATCLYAHYYREIYRRLTERHLDRSRAAFVRGAREDIFGSPELLPFWRGRQFADALGIPYQLYIELAMTYALRQRKMDRLPRPAQLFGDRMIEELQAQWLERRKSRVFVAQDPRYLLENYRGDPAQIAHQEWIMDQAQLRERPEILLGQFLYKQPMLHEERVATRFGTEMPAKAKRSLH